MRLQDQVRWSAVGAWIVGAFLVVAGVVRPDGAWLVVAGVFVVIVGLTLGRLKELAAGPFKAAFFQDFAEAVATQAATTPATATAHEPVVLTRTAADSLQTIDEAPAAVTRGGGFTAQAMIVRPQDVAAAKDVPELVQKTREYLLQQTANQRALPGLRGLSADRIRAESDLYAAILELQSDRHRSGDDGTHDSYEIATQEEIVRWWNAPASLDDDQVRDLAGRIRGLIQHRINRGPA
jgi:hypothetical protein